ncbi:MAG: transposase zinc-binding domain-containing protein, partial [Planctomycetia bacterium]
MGTSGPETALASGNEPWRRRPFSYPQKSARLPPRAPPSTFWSPALTTAARGPPETPSDPRLESWLEWRDEAERPVPGYVEEELRGYLECGILCFGFGRALCTGCGQGFVIAFSCKGRGVCPSCNGRHMAQTAAHLVDHVIPPVPVRQWVISVPKRLRCFLAKRPEALAAHTKIFLAENERLLSAAAAVTIDAAAPASARPRLGGISFLHRFGSALNHHVHLHACVTDGVFVPPAAEAGCDAPPTFVPARPITQADLAALTERVRRRVIRWFRMQRLLDAAAAADMAWQNSGFSIDASVRITMIDRDVPSYFQSLEHLLRYCARPPFALERLSVSRGPDGRIARIRYVLPRHKAAN